MPDTPDLLPSAGGTAARAIAGTMIRTGLKMIGTALVTRGLVDQGTVDGVIPTLSEELVGVLMLAGGAGWGFVRAWFAHQRFWAAKEALEDAKAAARAAASAPATPA